MKQSQISRKQYWVFLVVFSLCAVAGIASVVITEIFMPHNAGGNLGRLAMYRSMGTGAVAWACIAAWAGYKLRASQLTSSK